LFFVGFSFWSSNPSREFFWTPWIGEFGGNRKRRENFGWNVSFFFSFSFFFVSFVNVDLNVWRTSVRSFFLSHSFIHSFIKGVSLLFNIGWWKIVFFLILIKILWIVIIVFVQ
jgi:hypothetical protein